MKSKISSRLGLAHRGPDVGGEHEETYNFVSDLVWTWTEKLGDSQRAELNLKSSQSGVDCCWQFLIILNQLAQQDDQALMSTAPLSVHCSDTETSLSSSSCQDHHQITMNKPTSLQLSAGRFIFSISQTRRCVSDPLLRLFVCLCVTAHIHLPQTSR